MAFTRRKARKLVTAIALLVGSALLVLLIGGESLIGTELVHDGTGPVPRSVWEGASRFAWSERGRLPAPMGGPEGEAEPAIGFGSRDLYFSRRVPGREANWDLYRSRWTPRGYEAPEPLFELNTRRNERDPHLTRAGTLLVFASDRPGGEGGYDLYAAARTPDGFGEPLSLGRVVNSDADDRAPTTDLVGRRMVFASNRLAVDGVSYDLFETESLAQKWAAPKIISSIQLDDDGETRAPALSPHGRFLVFASDRSSGIGGYDLYRSVRHGGKWQPAVALDELNTELDESDPTFSPEGTLMFFARTREDGDGFVADLVAAERTELIPINDGDANWARLLMLLAALLAILLLTYLGLYWQGIHPFVKFVLMSLLVHLLVLLYLHGTKPIEYEGGGGGESAFVVNFIPSEDDGESSESEGQQAQGDQVQPTERGFAEPIARSAEREQPVAPAAAPSQELVSERNASESTLEEIAEMESPGRETEAHSAAATAASPAAQPAAERKTGQDARAAEAVANAAPTAVGRTHSNDRPSSNRGATRSDHSSAAPSELNAESSTPAPGRTSRPDVARATPGGAAPSSRATQNAAPAPRAVTANARERGNEKAAKDATGTAAVADATNVGAQRVSPSAGIPASDRAPSSPSAATSEGPATPTAGSLVASRQSRVAAPTPAAADGAPTVRGRAARPSPAIRSGASEAIARAPGRAADDAPPTSGSPTAARALAGGPRVAAATRSGGPRRPASTMTPRVRGPDPAALLTRRSTGPSSALPTARATAPSAMRRRGPARPGAIATGSATERAARRGSSAPAEAADSARKPANLAVARVVSYLPGGEGRGLRPTSMAGSSRGLAQPPTGDFIQARHPAFGPAEPAAPVAAHAQRRGRAKMTALEKGGGSAATEAAVLAGLRYLKGIQSRAGSWGRNTRHEKYGDFRVGKTGLALLAFLGSGYTHEEDGEFQSTVQRGISWLIDRQHRTGHFGDSAAYGHGIATYALAEAYAMTRDARLRGPLRRAARRIIAAQSSTRSARTNGGWPYYYRDPDRTYDRWPRMSVSVWQIMALKSAKIGGIDVPAEVLTRARTYVESAHDSQLKAFRYNHDPEWLQNAYPTLPGTTPAALFALQLLGSEKNTRGYRTALAYIDQRPPMRSWRRYSDRQFATQGLSNLYYLYYATLANFFEGGDRWKQWNGRLTSLLVDNQSRNGSWRPISYYAEYSADSDDDRVYTTAMCVLMLEVYYRYFTPLLTSMDEGK